jgi:hypothetical protein
MKSGLEVFDVARPYGLAALLSYADEVQANSPSIRDIGTAYAVELSGARITVDRLKATGDWAAAFEPGKSVDVYAPQWNNVLLTTRVEQKSKKTGRVCHPRKTKIEKVRKTLEKKLPDLMEATGPVMLAAQIGKGELLPGPLDPSGFKGLKHETRGEFKEDETSVDKDNWALACLGAALTGRFVHERNAGFFVVYPVPDCVTWTDFREVRKETYGERLKNYLSVQNAAAHYSVVLAENLRRRAASGLASTPRYSSLIYFSMFKTGNQWKPGSGGRLNLQLLIDMAIQRPHEAEKVLSVWRYMFRRGSARGNEDLALAITDLIMHPNLENYERHVRIVNRYIARGTNVEFQYTDQSLKEVMSLVSS